MAAQKSTARGTKRVAKRKGVAPAEVDLHKLGGRVVSVFGPFASRALVELPVDVAARLFPGPLGASGRTNLVEAVARDIEAIRTRAPDLADSALAAAALALAYEIEHPYNSATSKSMCARSLLDTLDRLRTLAPAEDEKDGLDDLTAQRRKRIADRARRTAAANPSRS